MIKVVIDTNFFMIMEKFHLDIFSEISRLLDYENESYEIVIMDGTLRELEKLNKKFLLEILNSQKQISIYPCKENYVDECILKFALEEKEKNNTCIVCTNDKELKGKLKKNDIAIITLKHKSKIDFG